MASSSPPPMHAPPMAATTGLPVFSTRRTTVLRLGSAVDLGVPNSRMSAPPENARALPDRKSTRLNSSHTEIYTLSLHDALPICVLDEANYRIEVGLGRGLGSAELPDVRAARERPRIADQHHGLDLGIGFGAGESLDDFPAQIESQAVHRRVVHGDHGRLAVQLVDCGAHAMSL